MAVEDETVEEGGAAKNASRERGASGSDSANKRNAYISVLAGAHPDPMQARDMAAALCVSDRAERMWAARLEQEGLVVRVNQARTLTEKGLLHPVVLAVREERNRAAGAVQEESARLVNNELETSAQQTALAAQRALAAQAEQAEARARRQAEKARMEAQLDQERVQAKYLAISRREGKASLVSRYGRKTAENWEYRWPGTYEREYELNKRGLYLVKSRDQAVVRGLFNVAWAPCPPHPSNEPEPPRIAPAGTPPGVALPSPGKPRRGAPPASPGPARSLQPASRFLGPQQTYVRPPRPGPGWEWFPNSAGGQWVKVR